MRILCFLLIGWSVLGAGCASHSKLIDSIPPGGFSKFDFFMGNVVSGGSIHCSDAHIRDGILFIDRCQTEVNTTVGSATMNVENYEIDLRSERERNDSSSDLIKRGTQTLR